MSPPTNRGRRLAVRGVICSQRRNDEGPGRIEVQKRRSEKKRSTARGRKEEEAGDVGVQ
jgi:hypothetical protein